MGCEMLVIGGGLTGLVAARRARQLGLETTLITSGPGSLPYTSGALDLLAVYPTETKHYRQNPWEALAELVEREPGHPYGMAGLGTVRRAWEELALHLEAGPLAYYFRREENILMLTAAGTFKPTHLVPGSMKAGVLAWESKSPGVVVGFRRLVDFSPEHVVQMVGDRWPGLRALRVEVVDLFDGGRVRLAELAAAFERDGFREAFAARLRPLLGDARVLGLPAVLGFDQVMTVCRDLSQRLGVEVFEIPMLSPSLPGVRLADLLREELLEAGVDHLQGRSVLGLKSRDGGFDVDLFQQTLEADRVLLATGRFFGGGLSATRSGVHEVLIGLPVEQVPESRDGWHMESFLGAPGHPINRAGLRADAAFRPLDAGGAVVDENLYAAGAILAGHDWVREKSGAGISVASGHAAVERVRAP